MAETLADLIAQVTGGYRSPVANSIARTRVSLPAVKAYERERATLGPQGSARDQMAGAYAPQPAASFDNGRYLGADAMEMTGLPALRRGTQHLANAAALPAIDQPEEVGAALPEIGMGGLGLLGMVGGGRGVAAELPARRVPAPITAEPVTRLPVNPTRELGANALPIAEPQPFRNSWRGGSEDLADAAAMRPSAAAHDAGGAPVEPNGGNVHQMHISSPAQSDGGQAAVVPRERRAVFDVRAKDAGDRVVDTEVVRNPSMADLQRLARPVRGASGMEHTSVRYVQDAGGNVYVFKAYDAIHDDVVRALRAQNVPVEGYTLTTDLYKSGAARAEQRDAQNALRGSINRDGDKFVYAYMGMGDSQPVEGLLRPTASTPTQGGAAPAWMRQAASAIPPEGGAARATVAMPEAPPASATFGSNRNFDHIELVGRDRGPTGLARYAFSGPSGEGYNVVMRPFEGEGRSRFRVELEHDVPDMRSQAFQSRGERDAAGGLFDNPRYAQTNENEATQVYQSVQDAVIKDMLTNGRESYVIGGMTSRLDRINRGLVERAYRRGEFSPQYRLERTADGSTLTRRTTSPPNGGSAPDRPPNGAAPLLATGLAALASRPPRRRTDRPPARIEHRRKSEPPSGGFFMLGAN